MPEVVNDIGSPPDAVTRSIAVPGRTRLGPRTRAFARQLAWALVTLFVISIVTYAAVNASHSAAAVARQALGPRAADSQIAAYVHRHDLTAPLVVRYGRWLADFVRGDWGISAFTQRPVISDVAGRIERTVILALAAFLLSLPVSLALGVFMARRWGRASDLSLGFVLVTINALPEFVVGIAVLILFSVVLGVLPPDSSGLSFGGLGHQVQAYVLPVLTLVLVSIPYIARVTRAAARDALAAPYTRAAVLRGLSRRTVIWDHAMRNAGPPVVNAVAINAVYLIGGVIVVENLFGFPGAGQDLVQAINHGDAATVQAIALLMGAMFIAISLLADLLVIYLNPRLKARAR